MSLPSPSDPNPIIEGPYAASRGAWVSAKKEASTAIDKIKAALNKTKDSRAAQAAGALERAIRRIPDAGCALEALADGEEAGEDVNALKENVRKTAQLASYYLRSDRLVAMVRDNPFSPASMDKIFARALQTIQRELR
jgi:hypothetical protein